MVTLSPRRLLLSRSARVATLNAILVDRERLQLLTSKETKTALKY